MCEEGAAEGERKVFEFGPEHLASCSSRVAGWDDSFHTEFDRLLLGRWEEAMRDGVFRYDLQEVVSRTVPGQYGFVALNNPKRFSHRRPPADMQMLVQPFDPNQFNFNRVTEKEVLFEVRRRKEEWRDTAEVICSPPDVLMDWMQGEGHMIAVNVSPIDRGHVLLVPEPSSCLPQVMTQSSLQLCLELVSLSGHSGFCMVANSLLAYASVNHLHYHFLYIDYPRLPARTLGGREVNGTRGCYQLTRYCVRGFGFQLDSDPQSCARAIFQVVSLLLESGVPYNIAMLRGPAFSDPHASDPRHPPNAPPSLVRTILIPRKPVLGFKQLYQRVGPPPPFFAASCELALGLIPIMDKETYATITEEEIVAILKEQELTEEEFSALVDRLSSYNETKS